MSSKLPSVSSPPWSNTTKLVVGLVTLALVVLVVVRINAATWNAIIISVLLAYLFSPAVTFFERRLARIRSYETRRTLAVILTWLLVLGTVALLLILIVPAALAQVRDFGDELPSLIEGTEQDIKDFLSQPLTIGGTTLVPWDELERMLVQEEGASVEGSLSGTLQDAVLNLADPALDVLGGAVSFLFTLLFALVMLFYLMRDGPRFANYLVESMPESYQGDARRLLVEISLIWNAYLRGQLALCTVIAVATYLAALILGLPQPLMLALVAGFLELIPNLGPALSQIPAILFALTTPSSTIPALDNGLFFAVVVSITYMAIQQLEAIFLVPRIMGRSLDLHPFVVLVAILIGASLAGVVGVVLAAPIAATLRLLGRYLRGKLLDEELFPTEEAYLARPGGLLFRLTRFFLDGRFPTLPAEEFERDAIGPGDDVPEEVDSSGWAL